MRFGTVGFSLDSLVAQAAILQCPSLIKIGVDGKEHCILGGASLTLANPNFWMLWTPR